MAAMNTFSFCSKSTGKGKSDRVSRDASVRRRNERKTNEPPIVCAEQREDTLRLCAVLSQRTRTSKRVATELMPGYTSARTCINMGVFNFCCCFFSRFFLIIDKSVCVRDDTKYKTRGESWFRFVVVKIPFRRVRNQNEHWNSLPACLLCLSRSPHLVRTLLVFRLFFFFFFAVAAATLTTPTTQHVCSLCLEIKFKSSASQDGRTGFLFLVYVHQKTSHTVEWTRSRMNQKINILHFSVVYK